MELSEGRYPKMNILLIGIGGAVGAITRYSIAQIITGNWATSFPVATLISNVVACLVLALTYFVFSSHPNFNTQLKQLVVIGFCGGLSTFSTFSFETIELIRRDLWQLALLNVVISLVACFSIIFLISKKVGV